MLLATMVGDALGAPYEGSRRTDVRTAQQRVEWALREAPLRYTDDTQMALGLAEHLCEHPHVDMEALARVFLERFQPWRGYGGGMIRLVAHWKAGAGLAEAASAAFPEGSFGNGAAMRVAPLGVRWADDPEALEAAVRRSAETTHVHPVGVDGARVQAHAVALATVRGHFGLIELAEVARQARTAELADPLEHALALAERAGDPDGFLRSVERDLGTEVVAHRSVPAALLIAAIAGDYRDAVTFAIAAGGDTDTIAAMAGAVCGAASGPAGIPHEWLAAVEDGPDGRSAAEALAARLAASA